VFHTLRNSAADMWRIKLFGIIRHARHIAALAIVNPHLADNRAIGRSSFLRLFRESSSLKWSRFALGSPFRLRFVHRILRICTFCRRERSEESNDLSRDSEKLGVDLKRDARARGNDLSRSGAQLALSWLVILVIRLVINQRPALVDFRASKRSPFRRIRIERRRSWNLIFRAFSAKRNNPGCTPDEIVFTRGPRVFPAREPKPWPAFAFRGIPIQIRSVARLRPKTPCPPRGQPQRRQAARVRSGIISLDRAGGEERRWRPIKAATTQRKEGRTTREGGGEQEKRTTGERLLSD